MAGSKLNVGNVEILVLHDNESALPLSMVFPNVAAADWKPYQARYPEGFSGSDNQRLELPMKSNPKSALKVQTWSKKLKSPAAYRVQVVAADAVGGSLAGSSDVAILRNFIPVLTKEQARSALKNVWQVLQPGGAIYVTDAGTLDDDRLAPQEVVWQNLMFINSFDQGGGRTEAERREWLPEAGFQDIERSVQPNGVSVMTAWKPE